MTIIQEACKYAQKGWKVFPLKQGTKIPLIEKWQYQATNDIEQIIEWWTQTPKANIGVVTGAASGIWVLDIDIKGASNGVKGLKPLVEKHGALPKTLVQRTASGGWHYFFNCNDDILRNTSGVIPGIDSRANGGYVVAPPSVLHDGSEYKWIDQSVMDLIADSPKWLLDALSNNKKKIMSSQLIEGQRNSRLTSIAGAYRKQGMEYPELLATMLDVNQRQCVPPLDNAEVQSIVQSVCRYKPEPTLDTDSEKFIDLTRFVNPLGVNHEGAYTFYPKNLRCIKSFSASSLMTNPTLYSIIGEKLLYQFFPKNNEDGEVIGFSTTKAALFLMDLCHKQGTYDPDMMKGIGVWDDQGRLVINTGKELIVDGVSTQYDDFESDYTYAQPGKDILKLRQPLSPEQIALLWKMICGFNWGEEYYKYLFIGALVQACIAPILDWRSHIWLIGAQGSGKSTAQFSIVRPLLGELCVGFEHGSTSSGIRQSLNFNAFTVSYDEAEVRDGDDPRNMQQVVALARISSSRNSRVVKGSASGDAVEYRCQSAFIMSSIKPYLKQESDLARFALLEVMPPEEHEREKIERFLEDTMGNADQIDNQFSSAWIKLCIDLIPRIKELKNKVFKEITKLGCSPRARDQYGQLIACAMAVLGEDQVDMALFNGVLDGTKDYTSDAEPLRELSKLLNEVIEIPCKHGSNRTTILNAVKIADQYSSVDYIPEDVNDRLCSYGLKVFKKQLYIANSNPKLEKIMGSPNWNNLFKIIPWVEVGSSSTTFGIAAYKSRYVKCSVNSLYGESTAVNSPLLTEKVAIDAGF